MTPEERAEYATREAVNFEDDLYRETHGVVARAPRAYIDLAAAYEVAADASIEAGILWMAALNQSRADNFLRLASEAFRPNLSTQLATNRSLALARRQSRRSRGWRR